MDARSRPLGKGSFGTVYRGRLRKDQRACAVKVMEKALLKKLRVPTNMVLTEVGMMRECARNDSFVQLYDFIDTQDKFYLLIELCEGGNLQDCAMACNSEGLGENQVNLLTKQMLVAIDFLHSRKIAHRDIKPHNFLVVGKITKDSVKLKLGDFGTAVFIKDGGLLKDQIGTPAFMAPEMHLLPNKSSGYDFKVDVWAAGVSLVFLLASEYPFIDGSGRLLRNKLIQGDVPLWEGNAFQSLFHGVGEAVGMRRKKPSTTARDLVRRMLAPRRQNRPSAREALNHAWFSASRRPPTAGGRSNSASLDDSGAEDNLPLLELRDFQEGFAFMEREWQWAMNRLGQVEIGLSRSSSHLDPSDERLQSCVVCYGAAGHFGYVCPQCHHAVCTECIGRMRDALCPYCRHECKDMAVTQKLVRVGSKGLAKQSEMLMQGAASIGNVAVDIHMAPKPAQENQHTCHSCDAPAAGSNYICPGCGVNFCFQCCKKRLESNPQCPNCQELQRNATAVPQYIAAHEAWAAAAGTAASLGQTVAQSFSDTSRKLSEFTSAVRSQGASRALGEMARGLGEAPIPQQATPALPGGQAASRSERCCVCQKQSGLLDHVCPHCSSSICAACIQAKAQASEVLSCPSCGDMESSGNMRLIMEASKARDSWNRFWGSVFGTQQSPSSRGENLVSV